MDGQEVTRFLAQNQVIVKTQFENAIKKRLDELDEEKRKPKRSGGSTGGSGSIVMLSKSYYDTSCRFQQTNPQVF